MCFAQQLHPSIGVALPAAAAVGGDEASAVEMDPDSIQRIATRLGQLEVERKRHGTSFEF